MLQFEIDTKAIDDQLAALVAKAQRAARLGAKAGAEVYYDAVKAQAPVSEKAHWFHGSSFKSTGQKYWFESGSLKGAVYQYFQRESSPANPTYHVAWNHRKVPYGFMVTAGTKRGVRGNDFVGDARKTVQARAIAAMTSEFQQAMK
jgi:hypothetical protein